MAWFMRGVQSAVFHYISCAPCHGYSDRKQKRKHAKEARQVRMKMQLERPELYHHPEPTGTNPYWQEEITMGPGPPPRRARRTNTSSTRGITSAGTQSSAVSQGGNSIDAGPYPELRLSDDTLNEDDEKWNHKRYQREDEDLWGSEPVVPVQSALSGSSVGVTGLTRPTPSRSESHCSVRAPPVNDLHPPIVSLPSPRPTDNRWMLQPPPKAAVMSGKERATNRSRSGSGASSRVELSLQRQVSVRQAKNKLNHGESPRSISRGSSYSNLLSGQRHDRPITPQTRPISAASSRRKRRDTTMAKTEPGEHSSYDSSDNSIYPTSLSRSQTGPPTSKSLGVRISRQQLSTVVSSGSGNPSTPSPTTISFAAAAENDDASSKKPFPRAQRPSYTSAVSSDALVPSSTKRRGAGATIANRNPSSDKNSLTSLQNLVEPDALLNTRFVSAPLLEAKIKLPPSDQDEEKNLGRAVFAGNGLKIGTHGKMWGAEMVDGAEVRVPFDRSDSSSEAPRDPSMRWSVDF
ncbi:unnamed protein product [Periconia digitata]|uniref:Uncharacterized protein n=1 Tax=Periconia digitata TaxID=1303443 RepID=A0A9W4XEG1_9PLEO|nr:unnamed protein product [Periconia digitata]